MVRYIKNVDQILFVNFLKQVEYNSLDEAKFAVKKNKVWGVLYFENGYSESLGSRIKMPENLTERMLNISDVNIWQDMSSKTFTRFIFLKNQKIINSYPFFNFLDQYVSNLLRRDMLSRYVLFLQSVFRDCEWPVALADIPIKVIVKIFTNYHKLSIKIFCFLLFRWKMQFTEITTRVLGISQLRLSYHC